MPGIEEMQPWDWLARWEAALRRPSDGGKDGWVTVAQQLDGDRKLLRKDDAWAMANKAVDDDAQAGGLRGEDDPRIDEQIARALLDQAKRWVRPRPVLLRRENRCKWREVQEASEQRGVTLCWIHKSDAEQRRSQGVWHRTGVLRAAGILQEFGRIFIGSVGFPSIKSLADLVVLHDAGILLVEMMDAPDPLRPGRSWSNKRRLARKAISLGLSFLFVGEPPPWVEPQPRTERNLRTPTGARIVRDRRPPAAKGESPDPPIGYHLSDPEELDGNGKLMIESLLAPAGR